MPQRLPHLRARRLLLSGLLCLSTTFACGDSGDDDDNDTQSTTGNSSTSSDTEKDSSASTGPDDSTHSQTESTNSDNDSSTGSDGSGSGTTDSDSSNTTSDSTSDSDSTGTETEDVVPVQDAFPNGLAVASPTTKRPLSRSSDPRQMMDREKSYLEKRLELERLVAAIDPSECAIRLPDFHLMVNDPPCYGPSLDYINHPDAADPGAPEADGSLPGGDLGLWIETSDTGEACAAAKLNSLVLNVSRRVDTSIYLAAHLICLLKTKSIRLPEPESSLDMTSDSKSTLGADNPGFNIREVILSRHADTEGGLAEYRYDFDVNAPGPDPDKAPRIKASILHRQMSALDTQYTGQVWGEITTDGGQISAYSLQYRRNDADGLDVRLRSANYNSDAASIFDDNQEIDIAGDWTGNIAQTLMRISPNTGDTYMSYAWQAGTGDSHSRVFHAWGLQREADPGSDGCGYFGYGPRFDFDTGTAADGTISTFICNWAGPGNAHDGLVNFAQKQCMSTDAEGYFVPTSSAIQYAPVNDCDTTDDPADADFEQKLTSDADYDDTPIPNALIDLTTDVEYMSWVAPTGP